MHPFVSSVVDEGDHEPHPGVSVRAEEPIHAAFSLVTALLATFPFPTDTELEALRAFRAAYRVVDDPRELHAARAEALTRLEAFDSERVVNALLLGYEVLEAEASPIFAEREGPLRAGGGARLAPSRRSLDSLFQLQERILAKLRASRSESALDAMVEALTRRRRELPVVPRAVLAERAVDFDESGARSLVQSTSRARTDEEVALLLRALRSLEARAKGAGPWVVQQLEHRSPMIRELAAHTLGAIAWPGSLEPLIVSVESGDGPLRVAAGRSLEILTRHKLGLAGAAWRAWFEKEGARFASGEERLGGGEPSVVKASQGGYYFGIPQTGESILYLYDNSNSMQNRLGSAARGRQASGPTRIERSREELERALASLGQGRRFNIVAFANRLRVFSDEGPVEATPENVERARVWLGGLGLELHTNTYDALELGFLLAGRGTLDRYYEPVFDTMFVLSDGAPTIPKEEARGLENDSPELILAAVRRFNAFGRVTIHAIGLGRGPGNRFLRDLAQQNGGRFESVR